MNKDHTETVKATRNFDRVFLPPKIYKPYRDSTWKKCCPVCFQAKGFEAVDKYRYNVSIIDMEDNKSKIWTMPRSLLKEISKARRYYIEDAYASISRWKKFWCRIFRRPILKNDPADNMVFEVHREGEGIRCSYQIRVR